MDPFDLTTPSKLRTPTAAPNNGSNGNMVNDTKSSSPSATASASASPSPSPSPSPSSSSYDTYQRASDCLRKLQQDIAIFRDPTVRSHLQTLPLQSPSAVASSMTLPKSPTTATTAEQQATIISLRTCVQQMEQSLRDMRHNDLKTRRRAARAEGQLSEVIAQRDATEHAHQSAVDEAANRIRSLEQDVAQKERKSMDDRRKLERQVEESKRKIQSIQSENERQKKRCQTVENTIDQMHSEIQAERKANVAEIEALKQAKSHAQSRAHELSQLLHNGNKDRLVQRTSDENSNRVQKQVDEENIKLKNEIEWISSKMANTEKQIQVVENDKVEMSNKMKQMIIENSKVKHLTSNVNELQSSQVQVAEMKESIRALQKEKNQMRNMIMALSDDGTNVEEGVKILTTLGSRQNEKEGVKSIFQRWLGKKDNTDSDIDMTEKKLDVPTIEDVVEEDVIEVEEDERDGAENKCLHIELEEGRKKIEILEAEVEVLKQQIEGELNDLSDENNNAIPEGTKDFDAKIFKVIHLQDNPLSRARLAYRKEKENKDAASKSSMADKTRGMKRGHDGGDKDDSDGEDDEPMKWKVEMEKQMKDMKQRAVLGDRTKAIALKRIEEVRSAVYNIFGWSMKVSGAVYELSSIYAESPLEVLHFCVNEDGGMSLMDCEYAQRLVNELEQYVGRMNSFPALLSHITMTNFEKSTAFRG